MILISHHTTIAEQLLAFSGRCPFRMYIPNKPARNKVYDQSNTFLGSNAQTKYMPLPSCFVEKLMRNMQGTNRYITMDNWFTLILLAEKLRMSPINLTIVETDQKK